MFRVIWVIDYVGEDTFLANLHPSSSLIDEFNVRKSAGKDLRKLQKELEKITYQQIDIHDHYSKISESTEISFEFTDSCIAYLDGIRTEHRGQSCILGLLIILGIFWLVKTLIGWIWPLVKPMLMWFALPLINITI